MHTSQSLNYLKVIAGINMDIKGDSGEGSESKVIKRAFMVFRDTPVLS